MKSLHKIFFLAVLIMFAATTISFRGFVSAQLTPAQEREQLEQELLRLEEEISQIEGDITKTQAEKKTLQNEIYLLKRRIAKLDLQIQKSTKLVEDLKGQIVDTVQSIDQTVLEIENKREQLAAILQQIYQEDQKHFVEILLTGDTLTDFFSNIAALESLNATNKDLLFDLENLGAYLGVQKNKLESEKEEEENFKKIQILQKQESQYLTQQNQQLLQVTQGKEAEYQKLLADRQKKAQEIRSRIFELIGVPEAPTFGEAVGIAKAVSQLTNVRPAFLLAVLTQESNIGKNVGQCYLKNAATGSGVRISTGAAVANVMKPSRDVQPFLQITQELGRDPFTTPVSCPIPSVGGYGGAMGPAQFIPSTWMIFKDRIAQLKGSSADPWNIRDAFLASGVYLANVGATKQTYEYEWCAAVSYFSGSCSRRNQVRYEFYGDSVMAIAGRYEEDIKAIENGTLTKN